MNVILEGFDGTGKSTLAKAIRDENPATSVYWSDGRPLDRVDYLERLTARRYFAMSCRNVVFDRFTAISEHIYRGTGGARFNDILLEITACHVGAVIHCTGSILTISPEHDGTERDKADTARLIELAPEYLMMYDILMSDLTRYIPVITFDKSEPGDTERVINFIRAGGF